MGMNMNNGSVKSEIKRHSLAIVSLLVTAMMIISVYALPFFFEVAFTDASAVGDWKVSEYNECSDDGTLTSFSSSDSKASDYELKIATCENGLIVGTYGGIAFSGAFADSMIMAYVYGGSTVTQLFGYFDDTSQLHLGSLVIKDGRAISAMAVYNRAGTGTAMIDEYRSIKGAWSNCTISSIGGDYTDASINVTVQSSSVFCGTMVLTSKSSSERTFSGLLTNTRVGGYTVGRIIDSTGQQWSLLTCRGAVVVMDCESDSHGGVSANCLTMTRDPGTVISHVPAEIAGRVWLGAYEFFASESSMPVSIGSYLLNANEQEGYLVSGTISTSSTDVFVGCMFSQSPTVIEVCYIHDGVVHNGIIHLHNENSTRFVMIDSSDAVSMHFDRG
jgi:hypothetical protein